MGFEASYRNKIHEVKWLASSLKPSKSMEVTSRHKRSKSESHKIIKEDNVDMSISPEAPYCLKLDLGQAKGNIEPKKKQSPKIEIQSSLKQEILQLEKRLQDQFVVRRALEKALGYRSSQDTSIDNSMPKPARELIKEIAVLEIEVLYLEQYLLSLYRKAFDQQISAISPSSMDERLKSPPVTQKKLSPEVTGVDIASKRESVAVQSGRLLLHQDSNSNPEKGSNAVRVTEKMLYSGIHRSHSSLSQRSACSTRTYPQMENPAKAVRAYYSQPLSMLENEQSDTPTVISLAEHLGACIADHIPETPNRLSEDMIKCMSAIYCKLADPPLMHYGLSFSPISSFSSTGAFSPQDQCDMWSPQCKKDSSFDVRLDNPFNVEGLKELSGPYSTMVEVPWICRDSQKLNDIEHMLQKFSSLVCLLEKVSVRKMMHEEKLSFWINIHNALVMHAFLAYGIPQNNLKRLSLLLKAAYNVGGHTISVDAIQSYILGCRMQRPGQWLRILFSARKKLKARDDQKAYTIEHPEPLLYFALCSGSHSDPAVRVYTPNRVFRELEAAKEEYIRATFGVSKEEKILLPKIVESFAKDSGLCSAGVTEMIQHCIPETLRKSIQRRQIGRSSRKSIEWVPHNYAFRYLISKELVR